MFGHQHQQPKAAAQPIPLTAVLSQITINFQFSLNRLPESLPNNSKLSTSNTYTGLLGGNMLDRLIMYLYIFDVATETNAAIERDKSGSNIISTFRAIISGFCNNTPFSVTFNDVSALHQWLEAHHLIPNIHDGKRMIKNDYAEETELLETSSEYQRYIATHVTNPVVASLKQEVKTLNADKLEMQKQITRLTNEVNRMKNNRQEQLDRDKRASDTRHRSAMNRILE